MNDLVKTDKSITDVLAELQNTHKLVNALMQTKHYAKIGAEGIYAIVQKARSMGIPEMDALNGALYVVGGKIEMTSQMMNRLIRMKGHSITKDPRSTNELCILHGKRADNGDVWTVSFGIADAKRAGLIKPNGVWEKYPSVMCFNRALSMLARQLFPDIIVDIFIEGELTPETGVGMNDPVVNYISQDQLDSVNDLLALDSDPSQATAEIKTRLKIEDLKEIRAERFEAMMKWLQKRVDDQNTIQVAEVKQEELPHDMPLTKIEASLFEVNDE
jgi:hypothetical protein